MAKFSNPLKRLLLVLAVGLASLPGLAVEPDARQYKVIVNADVPTDKIEAGDLKRIFLDKTTNWEGGGQIHLVLLASGPVHEAFLSDNIGKNPEQYASFWRMQSFTGKGLQPRTFEDEKEAVAYIAATKGAIGYVGKDTPSLGAKVLELK